jgi:hypothetical protein
VVKGRPVILAILRANAFGEAGGRSGPVPTAVPPWASSISSGQGRLDARDAVLDLRRIAAEFLAQRQRRRILGVGAADLDDVLPGLGLVVQRIVQVSAAPGAGGPTISSAQAICIAVGKLSFDDWLMV